jgi:hypothetical protein
LVIATDNPVLIDDGIRVEKSLISKDRVLNALLKTAFNRL